MDKLPLLNCLMDYHKENNLILSMPGNKCGKAFLRDEIGREFVEKLGFLDITENDPLDNLHNPQGVIKEAEELLAKTYGGNRAFFMVNGSSGGNIISIFSAFNEGDEVLVERNCHKSVYNGLILRRLKVTYIDPILDEEHGIFMPPNKEKIYEALKNSKDAKGIILTSPNYYGISYKLIDELIKELKERGLKIIIDAAHGAHFGMCKKLPDKISNLADYTILSAHKTIPSLTQGGYLIVNEKESDVDFYFNSFITTSPSYLIMASLDYGRYYLEKYGEEDYSNLINISNTFKEKINKLNKVYIIGNEDLICDYEEDQSRYVMTLKEGFSGHKLFDYLRKEKIQCEMSFERGVVLILSPINTKEDFEKIYKAIDKLNMNIIKENNKIKFSFVKPEKVLEPYEVFKKEYEILNFEECEGKIAKESIIPYPPGIPLICAGEVITKDSINIIKEYLNNKKDVIGVYDNKIKVIKNNYL
ncbi:decarboxylase [Clostridium baratii]|uniref:Arginine/lysine/ornithine decarboxylase n=1 Tax=Clostridium baratii TaxID=1561 RepID=A0A174TXW9_9CLOT|nr:aminotransferase class I/II-fold pyridoxal phosphate-dependent enzyme [Clostridium baratii]OPF50364.1 decarboxylase [Clostridium baratii]OPF53307.1 decarboxylase [Clostridium baratii]OPF54722.1 decarboxylase [Clostridium baratii]OPF61201.1 decarboxylase [Clostridium baratii]CUQ14762.1 arginine/lysine/ornithine decarboxylase [Clostridium baratii]